MCIWAEILLLRVRQKGRKIISGKRRNNWRRSKKQRRYRLKFLKGRNFLLSTQAAAAELLAAERKLGSARSGVEEIRGALEAVDRARRMQEQELLECRWMILKHRIRNV